MPAADSPDKVSYIRTLPEAECFELLAVAIVGRVGFVSPAGLQIIPMNYRLGAGHQLFMKTAPRQRAGPAGRNRCFGRLRSGLSRR